MTLFCIGIHVGTLPMSKSSTGRLNGEVTGRLARRTLPQQSSAILEDKSVLKALDRSIASASNRIVFLAPSVASVLDAFSDATIDSDRHVQLVREVQRFRGEIYLKDGAIQPHQLTLDGRHQTPEDENSWHMLLLDARGRVSACALYMEHQGDVTFDQLRVRHCAMAEDNEWRPKLVRAVQRELDRAKGEGLRYVELGGWAVSEGSRGTAGPLALAFAAYGFSRRAAGALGMTTATFRHCSATVLKRLGGSRFEVDGETLPPYYEPRYQCLMELLRFDSRRPNSKYLGLIDQMRDTLGKVTMVAPAMASAHAWCGIDRQLAAGLAS